VGLRLDSVNGAQGVEKMPERIQRKRTKGWRMPSNTISVTRPGPWGNPFRVNQKPDRRMLTLWGWRLKPGHWDGACPSSDEAVLRFRACIAFDGASIFLAQRELRGKNLACFCSFDQPCHADVLLEIANASLTESGPSAGNKPS
jgi:hypothetical protein